MHSIGYWYALVVLIILAGLLFFFRHYRPILNWLGFLCMFVTGLWVYGFRKGFIVRRTQSSGKPSSKPAGAKHLPYHDSVKIKY
jgi:hypothetical protein